MHRILLIIVVSLLFSVETVCGQIQFGGLAEFELRKGGDDSGPTVNQTPNDEWLVYVPSTRIFMNAGISDDWAISGALQYDYYYGRRSEVYFSSINLNWMPSDRFKVTGGRFITPYGRYDDLLLSSQNPFVHMPLSHAWKMPVDQSRGYVFAPTFYGGGSSSSVDGQSMVYRRLYSQGLMIGGRTKNETLNYQLAATLTSVSGHSDIGQHDRPAIIGRVEVQPVIWNKTGVSFSEGPYMVEDAANRELLNDEDRSGYSQMIGTIYTEFSYHYYQLLLQYTFNRWDSPWISDSTVTVTHEGEEITVREEFVLEEQHLNTDVSHYLAKFKMRFPFWVGGYGAVRYEYYHPHKISSDIVPTDWQPTPDKHRWEFAVGYQINRKLLMKASYLLSRNEGSELEDDVFAIQLSASF